MLSMKHNTENTCMVDQSCTPKDASYTKDLTLVDPDLSSIVLVDNSPIAYSLCPDNGIPIDTWTDNQYDECLLDLLVFLDALRYTNDVRSVVSLRRTPSTGP